MEIEKPKIERWKLWAIAIAAALLGIGYNAAPLEVIELAIIADFGYLIIALVLGNFFDSTWQVKK